MSGAGLLRIKKLKGPQHITIAATHNQREAREGRGDDGPIDPERTHLNVSLHGPAGSANVGVLARELMSKAGVNKTRKDAVTGLEVVVSVHAGSGVDVAAYSADSVAWALDYFGCELLSADIHLDEGNPHCHILLLPLVDGRMIGNKLMGGRAKLAAMQKCFYELVASRHGLAKPKPRMTQSEKKEGAALVLARLRETGDSALKSKVWATMRAVIENAPEQFLVDLGLTLSDQPAKRMRTSTEIFTSPGKGPKREQRQQAKPNAIAFDGDDVPVALDSNAIAFASESIAIAFTAKEEEQRLALCSLRKIITEAEERISHKNQPVEMGGDSHGDDGRTVERDAEQPLIDDDGVILGRRVETDDGITRERDAWVDPPDSFDQPSEVWA